MTQIRPAATVMVIRETPSGSPEVLLMRRNTDLDFASGFWVFPGGKIEAEEIKSEVDEEAARVAAIREAREEAGLTLDDHEFTFFCHWTTPAPSIKRFGTWFFMTHLPFDQSDVIIDDYEIKDYKWLTPKAAIQYLGDNKIKLLPPTFLIINRIQQCQNFPDIKAELLRSAPLIVRPRVGVMDGLFNSMYPGDAGYDSHDVTAPGPRHRLIGDLKKGIYRFEYRDCDNVFPLHGGYDW